MRSDEEILNQATKLLQVLQEKCWDGYKQVGMKKKGDRMVPNCVPMEETVLREITQGEYAAIEDVLEDMKGEDLAFNKLFDGKTRVVIDFPTLETESELGQFVSFLTSEMGYDIDWEKGMVSGTREFKDQSIEASTARIMGNEWKADRTRKIQMKIGKFLAKLYDLASKLNDLNTKVLSWAHENGLQHVTSPRQFTGDYVQEALDESEVKRYYQLHSQLDMYAGDVKARAMPENTKILKDLTEYWQKNAGYIKDNIDNLRNDQYSIIITRDPVDVLRMADFNNIISCHTPPSRGGGMQSYYKCAVAEAQGHGAVAYVVETDELLSATNTSNIDSAEQEIQEGEIFADETRGSHIGLSTDLKPVSRLRLRQMRFFDWEKYDAGEDDGTEIAVPEKRVYGAGIPGITNRIVSWARENQEETISNLPRSGGKIDLDDFMIFGGSHEDTRYFSGRQELLMQLTGEPKENFTGQVRQNTETEDNLPADWIGDISAQWEEECEDIKNEWNERYAATEVDFRVEEDYDGGFYIDTSARVIIDWDLDEWTQLPNSYPTGMYVAAEINEYYGDLLDADSGFINKKSDNIVRWGCNINLQHPDIAAGEIVFDPSGFNEMCSNVDTAIDDKRNAFQEIAEQFFKREGVMSGGVYMDLARKIENNEVGSYYWYVDYDGDYEESYESWAMIEYDFDPEALGIEPRVLFDLIDRREFALRLRGFLTGPAREDTDSEYWLSIRDKSAVEVGGEIRYQISFKVDSDSPDSAVDQFYELVTGEMDDEDEIAKAFLDALREEAQRNNVNLTDAAPEKERSWDNLKDLGERWSRFI